MFSVADPELRRPTSVAIGRKDDGTFRTSIHKEYLALCC